MAWLLVRLGIAVAGAGLLIAGPATLVESNGLGFMAAVTAGAFSSAPSWARVLTRALATANAFNETGFHADPAARAWSSGMTPASQAGCAGSIPAARTG